MKTILALLPCIALSSDVITTPIQLSDVSFRQSKSTQVVTVDYTLETDGEPAYILIDVLTNGVSIGLENIKSVVGDASNGDHHFVEPGSKTALWNIRNDWPGHLATNVTVSVNAWYTNNLSTVPGVYMAVDVSAGPDAESFPVTYTFDAPDPADDSVLGDKIFFKRIEPGSFVMGAPVGEINRKGWEDQHNVTFTKAFFIGVFEVTTKQFRNVTGETYQCSNREDDDYSAAGSLSYNIVRGGASVTDSSFFGILRAKTGLQFDLPTEAQWEYSCRAGATTAYYNGLDPVPSGNTDANLDPIAWYQWNADQKMRRCGTKAPNAWGLYDMLGNAREFCRDKYQNDIHTGDRYSVDPIVPYTGDGAQIVTRGGCYDAGRDAERCARRDWTASPSATNRHLGFRPSLTLD